MQALRLIEHERDIKIDVLIEAIEQALLSAYHRTPGAYVRARVEVDRRTGHVTVWAREPVPHGPDGEPLGEHRAPGLNLRQQMVKIYLEGRQASVAVVIGIRAQARRALVGLPRDLLCSKLRLAHHPLAVHHLHGVGAGLGQGLLGPLAGQLQNLVGLGEHLVRLRKLLGQRIAQLVQQPQKMRPVDDRLLRERHSSRCFHQLNDVIEDGVDSGVFVRVLVETQRLGHCNALPSFLRAVRRSAPRSASPTPAGTRSSICPPCRATSLTRDDAICARRGSPMTNTVSTSPICRFSNAIGSSASKSAPPRSPLTITVAPTSRQKSTSNPGTSATCTPSIPASAMAARANSTRMSTASKGCFAELWATATMTSANSDRARRTMSRCPRVTGSNDPGQTAMVILSR